MASLLPPCRRPYLAWAIFGFAGAFLFLLLSANMPAQWLSSKAGEMGIDAALEDASVQLSAAETIELLAPVAPLASMLGSGEWLNGQQLQPKDVQGKVVLVNFWTYSCINSLRPLPYLKAWAEKYRQRGLVVIGVHTPEFEFEKDAGNVRQALGPLGINYPVRLDSDYAEWRKFGNRAWPGFYLIDSDGRIRHQASGEGDYDKAERMLQKLLAEVDRKPTNGSLVSVSGDGVEAAANWADLRTPETYLGYARTENFASPGGVRKDMFSQYPVAPQLALNHWSLGGKWKMGHEFAVLGDQPGKISYRFHARDLHLVLGAHSIGQPVSFRVTIDGAAPGIDRGSDVDEKGWGTVREDRLYQLVRQKGAVTDRTFEIEFLAPGVRAYAFTFG